MADKKIPQLDAASQINSDALFAVSQQVSGEQKTLKGTVGQVGEYIGGTQTFSGLNTTSKNLVGAINEVAQGGSGGHTILDNEGDSLTQRSNLQFKGAYSEDDNANSRTKVNIVRSMTKAQFDLLSADEKVGFINVTDVTDGAEDKFQPVIYSEDEREIGVWLDGKPVYEKTIDFSSDLTVSYNGWTETTEDCSTVDRYLLGNGYTNSGTYGGNILCSKKSNNKLEIQTSRNGTTQSVRYLTVRYTKTTDTAGSGQWTPQGVPAVHYSTDEHIVGTWIDGSTLYEKTLEIAGPISDNSDYNAPHGITNLNNIVSHEGYAIYYNAYKIPIPYARSSTFFILNGWDSTNVTLEKMGLTYSVTDVRLTIRYTKSSS